MANTAKITIDEGEQVLRNLSFEELINMRAAQGPAADSLRKLISETIYPALEQAGVSQENCCKLLIYNGIVSLQAVEEFKKEIRNN